MEILTDMPQLDDRTTVTALLEMLETEKESCVRQQIVLILGFMRSSRFQMEEVKDILLSSYQRHPELAEKAIILEVMSNLGTEESVQFMHRVFAETEKSDQERLLIATELFKMIPRISTEP